VSRSSIRVLALAALLLAPALAYLSSRHAGAEQRGRDGVIARFDADISPNVLPRHGTAPVFVSLSGAVRATAGKTPPRLRRLEVAFGGHGGLDVDGLPTCPRPRLRNATHRQALERCRDALVGRGSILAEVPLARKKPLLARAGALAFNARMHGHPAVWVYAYSASPPVAFVLPFSVHMLPHGPYGLLLTAPIAHSLGRWPRLRGFSLTLGRRYQSRGRRQSYLHARCPLPPSFDELSAPVASATYRFTPRPTIPLTILRTCHVRD
jgi:hypothetical protein